MDEQTIVAGIQLYLAIRPSEKYSADSEAWHVMVNKKEFWTALEELHNAALLESVECCVAGDERQAVPTDSPERLYGAEIGGIADARNFIGEIGIIIQFHKQYPERKIPDGLMMLMSRYDLVQKLRRKLG